jgi:uncharacterized membrane protein YhaH (DUF805 family)
MKILQKVCFVLLLGSTGVSFALNPCPTSSYEYWHNCFGTNDEYTGEWRDNQRSGQGTSASGGNKYIGEWKNDQRSGQGTNTYAGGNKYIGEWRFDKRHGQGTYTFASGKVQEGIWIGDAFQYAKKGRAKYSIKLKNREQSKPTQSTQSSGSLFESVIVRTLLLTIISVCPFYIAWKQIPQSRAGNGFRWFYSPIGGILTMSYNEYGLTSSMFGNALMSGFLIVLVMYAIGYATYKDKKGNTVSEGVDSVGEDKGGGMNFFEAIGSGFTRFAVFSGRSSLSEFSYFYLFGCIIFGIFILFDKEFDTKLVSSGFFLLVIVIPLISVMVRRLHDVNRSGWWLFIVFTIIGIFPFGYWLWGKGDQGDNRFGSDPLEAVEYPESQSIESQKITEDTAYEMVGHELELGEQQIGLWTRAFADAEGDENKQRALYIKMRVAELTGKPKVNRVTSSSAMGLSSEPPARPLGERASGEQDLLGYIMQAIGYEYSFSATNVEEGYISKRGIESYVYSLLKERSKEISDEQYEKITAVQSFVRQAVISHNAFIIEVRQVFGGMMTEPSEGFDFFDPIVGEFRTELENQGIFFDF